MTSTGTSKDSVSDSMLIEVGRPGRPPARCFRLLLIGYFEGLDAERAIAWRAADSFALRELLGPTRHETAGLPNVPPALEQEGRSRA